MAATSDCHKTMLRSLSSPTVPITLNGSIVELGKPAVPEQRATGIMQSPDGQQVLQQRIVKQRRR
jgi:hypothetical protein